MVLVSVILLSGCINKSPSISSEQERYILKNLTEMVDFVDMAHTIADLADSIRTRIERLDTSNMTEEEKTFVEDTRASFAKAWAKASEVRQLIRFYTESHNNYFSGDGSVNIRDLYQQVTNFIREKDAFYTFMADIEVAATYQRLYELEYNHPYKQK